MTLPSPRAQWLVGHLGRWGTAPLVLLDEGAALGPVFSLRLWRRAVVGFSPEWNRLVLGDLVAFSSRGSMSRLTPYLAGGLVQTDAPTHRGRRQLLNPPFHRTALLDLVPRISRVTSRQLPVGTFDAAAWASDLMCHLLSELFFAGTFPDSLLREFLAPLDRPLPAPFVRRPRLFRRMNAELARALQRRQPGTLIEAFADIDGGVDEARVALGAAYDTTAHTLAWLLWHLAEQPAWGEPDMVALLVDETLRMYPAGWVGSRICRRPVRFGDLSLRPGTLVMYSPYLTHRDPLRWPDPLRFRPERFSDPLPAWGFIPFAAGERTCLGMHLAKLILRTVAAEFAHGSLARAGGEPGLRAGITLAPAGPVLLDRTPSLSGPARSLQPQQRTLPGGRAGA